jgi:aldose 1-epimerase
MLPDKSLTNQMDVTRAIPLSVILCNYAHDGNNEIVRVILRNENMAVELTNIGCSITAIRTPDKKNVHANIVAGYSDLLQYKNNEDYMGCVVGRFANRIANGRFTLNGRTCQLSVNNGNNHLHGGIEGFSRKLWRVHEIIESEEECGVVFSYLSTDGEEGYPGNLSVTVKYLLDRDNRLGIYYKATTDKSTPVSLTNHSYFNLTGFNDSTIYDHQLSVTADEYTVKSASNTPTGEIAKLGGTALDFRSCKPIGKHISAFAEDMGYDHCFILKRSNSPEMLKAAVLSEEKSGRMVTVYTDRPAMQVYTANLWTGSIEGEQGYLYKKHGGIALETQAFPDSPNHSHFPDAILHPGKVHESATIYEFGIMK